MRARLLVLAAALAAAALPAPATAALPPECVPPANLDLSKPAHYDFTMIYKSQCATKKNWDREFPDLTADNGTVSVTTSTALAGAIASVRWGGKEFIGSGGHGAAFQWALRPLIGKDSRPEPHPTECYNPTQAGSQKDDREHNAPFHGKSTSALYDPKLTGHTITAVNRMANYVPLPEEGHANPGEGEVKCKSTDYQKPAKSPFTDGLSHYVLWSNVALAPDHGLPLDNVIRIRADIISEDVPRTVATTLVAYTHREFKKQYRYNLDRRELTEFDNEGGGQPDPVLRCNDTGTHCLGFYLQRSRFPEGPTYFWAHNEEPKPYNAMGGAHTMEITNYTPDFRSLNAEVYAAVGNRDTVLETLDKLKVALK